MNNKAIVMKNEIRTLSKYRSLILSKYYLSITLGLISLYLGVMRYSASSLYILLVLISLPSILTYMLSDLAKKSKYVFITKFNQDSPFLLSYLKRKYRYTKTKYIANSISYFITLILLCLWYINYSSSKYMQPYLIKIPIYIMVSAILFRLLVIFFYQHKLHYDLINNKT